MRSIKDLPDLATPAEVAEVLRATARWVQEQCRTKKIESSIVAGRYLIERGAVERYIESVRVGGPCRNETQAPVLSGAKTAGCGRSSGSSAARDAGGARALKIAAKLKDSSRARSSSQDETPRGRVIHLNAR